MIVDVANLDLDILRCWLFHVVVFPMKMREYGVSCNEDYYEYHSDKASRYLWFATHCTDNITETLFCEMTDYIRLIQKEDFYVKTVANTTCPDGSSGGILTIDCGLTTDDVSTNVECNTIGINILQ
jgi:hypothetical protein